MKNILAVVLLLTVQAIFAMENDAPSPGIESAETQSIGSESGTSRSNEEFASPSPPLKKPDKSFFCKARSNKLEYQEKCDAIQDKLTCKDALPKKSCEWANKLSCAAKDVDDANYNPLKFATRVTFSCCQTNSRNGKACLDECLNLSPFHSMFRCKYTSVLNTFFHGSAHLIQTDISPLSELVGDPYLGIDLKSHCTAKCPFVVVTHTPDESPYVLDEITLKAFKAKQDAADATHGNKKEDTVKVPAIAFFDPKERVSPFPAAYKGYSSKCIAVLSVLC